jgi:ketosteroid isomerase-like protein
MTPTRSDAAREVVEAMFAAANRNDLDAQTGFFAPGATYRFETYGVDVFSREAIRQVVGRFLGTFPDRRIMVIATIAEGERVCVESDYAATSPGGIPGLPAAGEPFVSHLCSVYTVRDG